MSCQVTEKNNECIIENEKIKIVFSLKQGYFSFINKEENKTINSSNDLLSNRSSNVFEYDQSKVSAFR